MNPALANAVASPDVLTLRIHGLPIQMASTAVPAVLRDELAVLTIDLVEVGSGSTKVSAVDVVVTASEVTRIREKLLNSFAALYVQELAEAPDMPATHLRSSSDRPD